MIPGLGRSEVVLSCLEHYLTDSLPDPLAWTCRWSQYPCNTCGARLTPHRENTAFPATNPTNGGGKLRVLQLDFMGILWAMFLNGGLSCLLRGMTIHQSWKIQPANMIIHHQNRGTNRKTWYSSIQWIKESLCTWKIPGNHGKVAQIWELPKPTKNRKYVSMGWSRQNGSQRKRKRKVGQNPTNGQLKRIGEKG